MFGQARDVPEQQNSEWKCSILVVLPMLQVYVTLVSGKRNQFSMSQSSKVGDLKCVAQRYFEQGFLKLVTAEGRVLADPMQPLQAAGLQDGEHLTAVAQQAKMVATEGAFAIWCHGGRIVTWGRPDSGGDSSEVQDRLRHVQQVHATSFVFVAILADGSVVTWGDPDVHPDFQWDLSDPTVQDQLRSAKQIQSTRGALAAILVDGSILAEGDSDFGGDSSAVESQLRSVQEIQATARAFAAILADGSVVTWGNSRYGGGSSAVQITSGM